MEYKIPFSVIEVLELSKDDLHVFSDNPVSYGKVIDLEIPSKALIRFTHTGEDVLKRVNVRMYSYETTKNKFQGFLDELKDFHKEGWHVYHCPELQICGAFTLLRSVETVTKTVKELVETKESPLPLEVIPNHMGINLCSVESLTWTRRSDGQLMNLQINFNPSDSN